MDNLTKEITVTMVKRPGESDEDAEERLYKALYDGLCNNAEHQIDFCYN